MEQHGQIISEQSIASGDGRPINGLNESMNAYQGPSPVHDDISWFQLFDRNGRDREHVVRPESGEHAATRNLEAEPSGDGQRFSGEITLDRLRKR